MATHRPKTQHGIEDAALPILEWLAEQGVNAFLRVDAERLAEGRPAWSFGASGGPLPHGIRADGADADQCLSLALSVLHAAGVDVPY
ncbi:hypothetical protein [Actinomadura violacea]|uniref:Uncharacterized protein n=1 Tax=Actinomadura violacea TaxID=2819934 RepID=A0ABS3RX51_9ACTN|nr:hypothetical protein [Actinomadura violacea]MBO2461336.1 hypothetical protein [Actinomadura violacea]